MDHSRLGRMWRLILRAGCVQRFLRMDWHCVRARPGTVDVDGVAVALRVTGRSQELVAATGAWTRRLEELEYTVGDGPAVEAHMTGEPVLVPDAAADAGRWPGFAKIAGEAGLAAVSHFRYKAAPFG